MITLPLFHSESLAVPKLTEQDIPINQWVTPSEALPADGIPVYCYLSCNQHHRHFANINELMLVDGQWVPAPDEMMANAFFPIEAVRWWIGIEPTPKIDHPDWLSIETLPEPNCNMDIWIWNDQRQAAYSFWIETGKSPCSVDGQLYYSSGGDPVLHDEHVVKWMPRVQSEDISTDFSKIFRSKEWAHDIKLPAWLLHANEVAREGSARLFHRSRQLKLDFPRVS